MKPYVQEPPFAVQIEFTEGCNFSCTFCGLQGIRSKPGNYKFMTQETATRIAEEMQRLEWAARVEFAMHGEPSFNPNRDNMVRIFRAALPGNQLMMTSNGSGFVKDAVQQIQAIFDHGLNILALDDYDGANMVPRIRKQIDSANQDAHQEQRIGIEAHDYPKAGLQYAPHRRWPVTTHQVIYIEDISRAAEGTHATLNNHCGAAFAPNNKGKGRRCAKPFRELSIRWDGSVAICCNDWRGVYKIGNINSTPLDMLWNHPRFNAARRFLYRGQRTFNPCEGCDALSYRVGLLPDQRGKKTLPKPTDNDFALVHQATRGQTLTQIVLRPWEQK